MCGGGGGGGSDKALDYQKEQERLRQQRIAQGREQLDEIFSGLEGGEGEPSIPEQQQQAFLDYANPQVQQQMGNAQQDLTFALARSGQNTGSLAANRQADLEQEFQLQQQSVADQAMDVGNKARENIASQRQSLLNLLNATADPGQVATQARQNVANLAATPAFSPVGPLFQNVTSGLAGALGGYQQRQQRENINSIIGNVDPDRGTGSVLR